MAKPVWTEPEDVGDVRRQEWSLIADLFRFENACFLDVSSSVDRLFWRLGGFLELEDVFVPATDQAVC
jgi:hypothetical protein